MALPPEPTADEIAAYEKAVAEPAYDAINPIKDLNADELFTLAVEDKENFDLGSEFRKQKDLWGDKNTVDKVKSVYNRLADRGFELSDIPGVKEASEGKPIEAAIAVAKPVLGILKGIGKQAWNYTSGLVVNPVMGIVGSMAGENSGFTTELAQQGQRQIMENLAGTEAAVTGLSRLPGKIFRKGRRTFSTLTPEEKDKEFWDYIGEGEVDEEILKGKGGLLGNVGGEVRKELEAAGKPIRPEEASQLAAGDPASFYAFGKIFQGAGKLIPSKVAAAGEKVVEKAEKAATVTGGRAIQTAGALTDIGGKAVKILAPAAGMVKGAIEAGPIGALAGLKGGEIVAKVGGKISKGGKALAEAGKEIAGATPVTSGATQLAKDVIGGVPVAAAEVGKGLAFDIGTAALTSESPRDTESVGIGAFFGGLGAGRRVGQRVISGQIVGPRAWGSNTVTPSSGKLPVFDSMHADAIKDATPAVQTRLNAIREFLKGSHTDTDIYLAKDAPTLERVLTQSGLSPEQARNLASTEGFFSATLPDAQGNPRRVIIARNVDAAPHEAFHAIQDVLGESANQAIDQIVREEYGPQWEAEGQRYAARIGEGDWREVILDSTGTGLDYAKEKIAMDVANEYRMAVGGEPPAEFVQDRVKAILGDAMDKAVQANPQIDPNEIARHVWRDILTPEESTAVADSYLARELAAENFDMVFKHGGTSLQNVSGLTGRLARIVAQLVSTLGGESLSPERPSQIGEIAPRFRVTEAVREAPGLVEPRPTAPSSLKPTISPVGKLPVSNEPVSPTSPEKPAESEQEPTSADEARTIAAEAPDVSTVAGTASPREILGNVAEAIAQQAGLKVNYLSAEGEGPAASISSNRDARRAVIEAFRTMPPEARALWEKNFFPDRVVKLKGDKFQILGWAPEVFASNAHKLAAKLQELGVSEASPYAIKEGTFTPEAWQELFNDVQTFVKNQMGGRTGAGESLVVPKEVAERGFFAPPIRGRAEALPQLKADFINMLFGIKLPDTARIQKGRLPLNIAGQAVSEATQPGRTEIPVIPRGKYEGAEASRQGIAGRDIMEVNPLRQQIEAAAQAKGVAMPEFIEAQQRLNLENIKNVEVAPELPQFRGNVLTLTAGFQPSSKARAVKSAAIKDENGKVYEGFWHGAAQEKATAVGAKGPFADGFTTNDGEFLTRGEALERAKEMGQVAPETKPGAMDEQNRPGLETSQLMGPKLKAKIPTEQKAKEVASMTPEQFRDWSQNLPSTGVAGFTEVAHEVGLKSPSREFVDTLKVASEAFGEKAMETMKAGDFEKAMILASQQQFFREAWEAATGEGSAGYHFRKEDPNWKPKFPLDKEQVEPAVQMQPTPEEEAVGRRMDQRSRQRGRPGRYFFEQARRYAEEKRVPTDEQVTEALSADKKEFVGAHRELEPGTAIGVRIDIPAFERTGTYVQTVHEKAKGGQVGKRLGYDSVVTVDDPVFFSNEKGALKIKEGAAKFPIATVEGKYNTERTLPEDIDEWTEVGFNPKRHSYFYEKSSEEPVLSGDKAVAVGNSVFVKNPVFGDREKFAFQPEAAEEKRLPTKRELSEMTPEQLGEVYPEAVIPKTPTEPIPSDIKGSPLYKRAIDEDAAVKLFGDKLAEFSRESKDDPLFNLGRKWYEEFTPQLKKEFGSDAQLFAELLAATSPQTSVASNFGYAVDAVESFRRGRFTKIMGKFHQGLDMIANDTWKAWYNRELKAGNIPDPPAKPTTATFMEAWINKHNLKPRQTNGSLYGTHSLPVLQVFARQWLTKSRGPKTLNFVENLLGTSDEATIDLWADRTMRRIGYEGEQRWRILPKNIKGVSDADFAFSQKAFRHAANQLGMKPSSLQAALWFAEKGLWDKNGWSKLDLGDFREQMKRLPALREGIEQRLTPKPKQGKIEYERKAKK